MKSNIIKRLINVFKLLSEGEQLYNSLKDGVNGIKDQINNVFKKITEYLNLKSLISNLKQKLLNNFEKVKTIIKESIKNLNTSDFIYFIKQKIMVRIKNYINYLINHNPIERYLQRNGIDLSSVDGFINNISNLGTNLLFELFKKTLRKGLNKIKSNNSSKNIVLLEEKSNCVHIAISNICHTTKEKLTIATGIVSGENGASIEESLLILDVLGLNAKVSKKLLKCEARLVERVLTDENTDQGIFFISGKSIGHAQKFYKENSDLLTIDGEQFNNDKSVSSNKGASLTPYNGSNNTHILTVYKFTTQSAKFKSQEIEKMQSGYRFTTGKQGGELYGIYADGEKSDVMEKLDQHVIKIANISIKDTTLICKNFKIKCKDANGNQKTIDISIESVNLLLSVFTKICQHYIGTLPILVGGAAISIRLISEDREELSRDIEDFDFVAYNQHISPHIPNIPEKLFYNHEKKMQPIAVKDNMIERFPFYFESKIHYIKVSLKGKNDNNFTFDDKESFDLRKDGWVVPIAGIKQLLTDKLVTIILRKKEKYTDKQDFESLKKFKDGKIEIHEDYFVQRLSNEMLNNETLNLEVIKSKLKNVLDEKTCDELCKKLRKVNSNSSTRLYY